jgi:hypothetical protein
MPNSKIYSHSVRDKINMKRRKAINPKYYPTKTLEAFRDNDYVGIDGLDREQYKDEIDQEFYRRLNRLREIDSKTIEERWNDWCIMRENMPPEFPYEWSEEIQDYIIL